MKTVPLPLRHALFGTMLFAASLAAGQDWIEQGGIKSREYKKEIRGNAGVEATEFFTLDYSVAIKIEDTGATGGSQLNCTNRCKGKKHKKHAECDFSCDDKCPEKEHKATVQGEYYPDLAAMREATRAANQLAIKGGGTVSPNDWSHRVSRALAEFRNECKKKKTFSMPHVDKPCAGSWQLVGFKSKSFTVRGTMRKVGYRMSRGMRTPIDEVVGTHEQKVAQGVIVQDDPLDQHAFEFCLCFDTTPPPPEYWNSYLGNGFLSQDPRESQGLTWRMTNGGVIFYDAGGKPLFTAQVDVQVIGNDMNTVKLVLRNSSGQSVKVVLPPGTIFLPADPRYQIMCALTVMEALLESGETQTLYVNVGPPPPPQGEGTLRWACMEMSKKEPDPSVKYRMQSGTSDAIANLAAITARSRFRGPHDQARIWIYTDKAPREEINKRMIPGVSPGMYTLLLRDVATKGGVDFSERAWSPLVQPNLLEGLNLDDKSAYWLLDFLIANKEKDLAAFVNGKAQALAQLVAKEGDDGAAFASWIATALFQSGSMDLQRAGAKLLTTIPEANRAALAKAGGLEGLRWLMAGDQEAACALALDVLEAYAADAKEIAMAFSEALPSDALKARAAKLAGVETAGLR
jgi:hypothetical protein